MKKSSLLLVAFIVLASCQKATPVVDREAAKKAVNDLYEAYGSALKAKDATAVATYLDDDGLFIGTDPDEFWSKQKVLEVFGTMALDSAISWDFHVDKREVRISQDGMMAVVAEQYFFPFISKKIAVRGVSHARFIDGKWKIDFYSWSLSPTNDTLMRLNSVLE